MSKYIQRGETIDYTAGADIAAGDIVFVGDECFIAQFTIPNGATGAITRCGVFEIPKDSNAITYGAVVFWDAENKKGKAGQTTLEVGICVKAAESTDTTVTVLLNAGKVKQAAAVADCTPSATALSVETQFNALTASLRAAGLLAPNA